RNFRVILSDFCSNQKDTAYFKLIPAIPTKIPLKLLDSTVCSGSVFHRKIHLNNKTSRQYNWQWIDLQSAQVLSHSDSLHLLAYQDLDIQVRLSDQCNFWTDSAQFKLNVMAPLQAEIQTSDTVLCRNASAVYQSLNTGGLLNNYSFTWLLDNQILG